MKKIALSSLLALVIVIIIIVLAVKPDGSNSVTTNELDKAGDYIRENISALSPIKESLGGKFFITTINFKDEEKRGLANYEDGHNAYSAAFEYSIGRGETVEVSDFQIVDPLKLGDGASFHKTGNITKSEKSQDLVLVYEEPGKPALTKILALNDDSLCLSGQEIFYCTNIVFTPGDRAEVKGQLSSSEESVEVLVLIKK